MRAPSTIQKKIACLLPAEARIFGVELGLSGYGEHQGMIDPLATHSDVILTPLNITLVDFLVLYRDANDSMVLKGNFACRFEN